MLSENRFFRLLKIWKKEGKEEYIPILRTVMLHYFDTLSGYKTSKKIAFEISNNCSLENIEDVLNEVGYTKYIIDIISATKVVFELQSELN